MSNRPQQLVSNARILVIRGGAIGDFILTLPVLVAIHRLYPRCQLEVLGYPKIACLAVAGGLAVEVKPLESPKLSGFFSASAILDEDFSSYFARFDLILSFASDPDGVFQRNVSQCSPAPFIQGPHRPAENALRHATEVFLQVLGEGFDPTPRLHISIPGRKRNGFWLAIHPGSGSERKNWPQDRWRTLLLSLCTQTDLRFLLIGGEAEQGRLQRLASHLPAERFEIADDWPLPELAAAITRCASFIGHDSGIGHLAAALGLPGLILWGPSNPVIWRPRSDKMQLLQAPNGLAQLAESTVEKALFRLFPALDF